MSVQLHEGMKATRAHWEPWFRSKSGSSLAWWYAVWYQASGDSPTTAPDQEGPQQQGVWLSQRARLGRSCFPLSTSGVPNLQRAITPLQTEGHVYSLPSPGLDLDTPSPLPGSVL